MVALNRIVENIKANGQITSQKPQKSLENLTQKESYEECIYCKGTTWIRNTYDDGSEYWTRCKCYEIKKIKQMWTKSGISTDQVTQTFGNFQLWNEQSKQGKETALRYLKEFEAIKNTRYNSIAFLGQVGSGKTHLSVALAVNFLNKGIPVIYMPYRDCITKIKQNIIDEESYRKTVSMYQSTAVLLIDDLFKGKVTESDINIMFEIINYRYLNYLPVIISSEFTADKLLSFDEAIASRLLEMCKKYTIQIEDRENNYRLK